jgi:hypothetical protein
MAFVKTTWVDRQVPKISAAQLNRIEQGIADAHTALAALTPPAMVKIGDFSLVGNNVQYASIPQTFTHLRVMFTMQSARAASANTGARLRFNAVASSNYDFVLHGFHGVTQGSDGSYGSAQTWGYLGQCPAGTRSNDGQVLRGVIDIPYYKDSTTSRMALVHSHMSDGISTAAYLDIGNQFFGVAQPITQIDLMDDVNGALGPKATASLYGIT